jgi:hypothetical protein
VSLSKSFCKPLLNLVCHVIYDSWILKKTVELFRLNDLVKSIPMDVGEGEGEGEYYGKDKDKLKVPCHVDVWGNGGIAACILNLDARCRRMVSFTPRPLYPHPVSAPVTHWVGGLGGPQSRPGRGGEEKKSHHAPCNELNPGRPARSLVTIPTRLPWLLHI